MENKAKLSMSAEDEAIQRKRREAELSRYDGSVPFIEWLNNPQTTRSKMKLVENILSKETEATMTYLVLINKDPTIESAGFLAGEMFAMKIAASLREIYFSYHQGLYKVNQKKEKEDMFRVHELIKMNCDLKKTHDFIINLLVEGKNINELTDEIIIKFHGPSSLYDLRKTYCKLSKENFIAELLKRMGNEKFFSTSFLSSFSLGFLSKLKLLNNHNDHRTTKELLLQLNILLETYRKIFPIDSVFVLSHLSGSINEFMRNETSIIERIHWLYVSKVVYKQNKEEKSIEEIISFVAKYSEENKISINFNTGIKAFSEILLSTKNKSMGFLNKVLGDIMDITL